MERPRRTANLWLVLADSIALWLILGRSAAGLGSYRGEFGVVVCLVVLAAALAVEVPISRVRLDRPCSNSG
jgi:hypothetical protein